MLLILSTLFILGYSKEESKAEGDGKIWLTLVYTFLAAFFLTVVNLLFRIWTKSVYDFKAAQFAFDGQLIQASMYIPLFFYLNDEINVNSTLMMALSGVIASTGSTLLGLAVAFGKAGPS